MSQRTRKSNFGRSRSNGWWDRGCRGDGRSNLPDGEPDTRQQHDAARSLLLVTESIYFGEFAKSCGFWQAVLLYNNNNNNN